MVGSTTRRSSVGCGGVRVSISRAERLGFAISYKTRWRWSTAHRKRPERKFCERRRGSSKRSFKHRGHPPAGRAFRPRKTDDLSFLLFVPCHYVRVTGDAATLDDRMPF